ncbi:protein FAM13A [Coccinella septempunctata]|uniref:protein FAM13A n=1 Tax=Coccinella septempunctata TaxID=41139 RepID=UPI001D0824BC|nr:protein FAM13A [Coccinella septempunctata]XP_044752056.1 protein FAM13A [Coccinella septempunctata]
MKGPVKKEDTKKESFVKKEQKDKKLKAKNILLHSWLNRNEQITTTEEAKVACKARKRKERQESISSLCQERKVIRSNSEERPHSRRQSEKDSIIRRVSSSEDLHIRNIKNKRNQSSKENIDVIENNVSLVVDECEHEKRRSHERFAKPLTLKCKKSFSKRPKGKSFSKTRYKVDDKHTQHEVCSVNLQISEHIEVTAPKAKKERSPSPHRPPSSTSFDLSTLHQQVDDSEPLPSCSNRMNNDTSPSLSVVPNRLLSSPRNSIIATHCIYLDPDVCVYNNGRKVISPAEEKMQKISKQLSAVKKKIKKFEGDFQLKHGFKPSHFDKMCDAGMKKHYMDLTKLKKEFKLLQESGSKFMNDGDSIDGKEKCLQEIMKDIELKLETKREFGSRTCKIEEMTQEQLSEEKVAVQKALLHLENVYGRPINKEDRDLVRPLYDRYRNLKRLVAKAALGTSVINDLETIHEDETAHFVADTPKTTEAVAEKTSAAVTDSDTDVSINENLHAMDQEELRQQMKLATEEKKVLKRTIKEYELSVQQKTGKMVQKEDKQQIQQLYRNYKTVKSKIRLLDALISKQN